MQISERFILVLHRFYRLMSNVPKYALYWLEDDSKKIFAELKNRNWSDRITRATSFL